jgi:hypothetical protein
VSTPPTPPDERSSAVEAPPPPPQHQAPPENLCPRCGTQFGPDQEYCLECGLRLPVRTGVLARLGAGWRRSVGWYPGDWMWPALLALVIAGLGAAAAIHFTDTGRSAQTVVGTTGTQPGGTETQPTAPEPTTSTTPTTTSTKPKPKPKPKPKAKNALTPWPPRAGWTVILASIPTSSGRAGAVAQAKRALAAGLKEVGVLVSSRFSTLHPGYYVVFSGTHSSEADAQSGAAAARTRGYSSAYTSRVAR